MCTDNCPNAATRLGTHRRAGLQLVVTFHWAEQYHSLYLPKEPPPKRIPLVVHQCLHCWVQGYVLGGRVWSRTACNTQETLQKWPVLVIRLVWHEDMHTEDACRSARAHTHTHTDIHKCTCTSQTQTVTGTVHNVSTHTYLNTSLWQCSQKGLWFWLKRVAVGCTACDVTLHHFTIDASVGQHKVIQYGKSWPL